MRKTEDIEEINKLLELYKGHTAMIYTFYSGKLVLALEVYMKESIYIFLICSSPISFTGDFKIYGNELFIIEENDIENKDSRYKITDRIRQFNIECSQIMLIKGPVSELGLDFEKLLN